MNTNTVLKYGHQTVAQTVERLPKEAWNTPGVCGVWSVKDIIAHLASFEQLLVDVLNALVGDGPTPTLDKFKQDYVGFNDAEVEARQDKSASEVWAEYESAHAQTLALIEQIPAKTRRQNNVLPWYGTEYDLDDFIAYTYYGHKREHSAQIAVFADGLKNT